MFNILGLGCLGRFGWRVFGVNAFQGLVLESVASRIGLRVCVCVCVISAGFAGWRFEFWVAGVPRCFHVKSSLASFRNPSKLARLSWPVHVLTAPMRTTCHKNSTKCLMIVMILDLTSIHEDQ